MGIILIPILKVLLIVVNFYVHVVFVAVIMSWLINFNVINIRNRFVFLVNNFVNGLVEPPSRKIRKILPPIGGIDFSPFVLVLGAIFIQELIIQILQSL